MRESEFALLRDPRLAAHATSAMPAWLWSTDGLRLLWSNAVGAAIFGATTTAKAAQLRFGAEHPAAAQIVRMAGVLPQGGQTRLERLRGFGAGFGRMLICACSRVTLADKTPAILVAATEPAGPALSLTERARRLIAGEERPLAIFANDGALIDANDAGRTMLGGVASLTALGAEELAAVARADSHASGTVSAGTLAIDRIGSHAATVLIASFAAPARQPARAEPAQQSAGSAPHVAPSQPVEAVAPVETAAPVVASPELVPPERETVTPEREATLPAQHTEDDESADERRHPLRFVWQMNGDGHFVIGSDEFVALMGPRTTAAFGRLWTDIATELNLDPERQVERALASRETWSGVTILWPVDGSSKRLPVELSGLPVFDRDRNFRGYRGFGVCRDLERINELNRSRRTGPLGFATTAEPAPAAPMPEPSVAPTPETPAAQTSETPAAPAPSTEQTAPPERPALSVVPATANVVPFRSAPAAESKPPSLSPVERKAFRDLAQELTSRLKGDGQDGAAVASESSEQAEPAAIAEPLVAAALSSPEPELKSESAAVGAPPEQTAEASIAPPLEIAAPEPPPQPADRPLLDRVPVGVLVYRHDSLLYANRAFLEWTGYDNLGALTEAGGLDSLFVDPGVNALVDTGTGTTLSIATQRGDRLPVEGRLFSIPWQRESALALIVVNGNADDRHKATELALRTAEGDIRELEAILDTATDGVMVLDREGNILAANRTAESLFGRNSSELERHPLGKLFAPESERAVRDYFDRIARGASALGAGLDVAANVRGGGLLPLSLSIGRIASSEKFCAVLRDNSHVKKIEEDVRTAKREAQKASVAKADFLAKLSHEIRTPLNAMTGFAEVMMAERFGSIGNERYRTYLKDIHASGNHLVSLLNDLLDLSKIEAGTFDLTFANVNLNELTQQCVAIMQPQANKERIIIRTSLTPGLAQVVADARSVRQIVLNLLSNSIKFTGPGGQVIVSTALADGGEAVLRVRDTGIGMSEKDIEAALEPFRQIATSGSWGSGGTGLGLPLTRALAEANRATFSIKSAPNAGTLVEIAFPASRVLAE
jgi:PAS domain S-box-containing protein